MNIKNNKENIEKKYQKIDQIVQEHGGIVFTRNLVEAGISKPVFYSYVRENRLEKLAHGVYADINSTRDEMYLLHLRSNLSIFSHETALKLHGFQIHKESAEKQILNITLATGYNPSHLTADGIKVYTVKKDLLPLGKIEAKTQYGYTVYTYDIDRSICDIIRSRNKLEEGITQEYIKQYAKRVDKNLKNLTHYAYQFRINKILNGYLELLL